MPLHLTVLTTARHRCRDEALPYPEKATAMGPARVIPRELPGVTCATLDVELPPCPGASAHHRPAAAARRRGTG
jgi:hypothetical protein